MKFDQDLLHLSLTNLTKGLEVKSLIKTLVLTSALVAPGFAYAQSAQTFNMQVPSASSTYTDGSGNTYTLSIPSTINIGTLTFTPANSGPSIVTASAEGTCGSGVTTCSAAGMVLTSGDKLLVRISGDQTLAATPVTLSGGLATIGTCSTMTNGTSFNSTASTRITFLTCSITASGTPTNIVGHYSAASSFYGDIKAWDIHGGSDHGNGAGATGNSATASVTTAAGVNGQPSVNALIFSSTEVELSGTIITQTSNWTVDLNTNGVELQHEKAPSSGAITASNALSQTDQWNSVVVAIQ